MPAISIIVPVYKAEQYLPQCIESILAQTFADFELILVDDGSPDNSGAICDTYAQKDSRIKVIHKENAGVSAARNAALDIASGTYIMFCDSDDWVEPEWCQSLYDAIQKPNVVMAVCGYNSWKEDLTSSTQESEKSIGLVKLSDTFGAPISGVPWNKIFDREQIEKHGIRFPVGISYGEDLRFLLIYLTTFSGDKCVYFTSTTLNNYRIIDGSLSHKCIQNYWQLEKEIIKLRLKAATAHDTDFEKYQEELYYYYYRLFYYSIKHLFTPRNAATFFQKYQQLQKIVKSEEFAHMQKSRRFDAFPSWYRFLLKNRVVSVLFIYHILRG